MLKYAEISPQLKAGDGVSKNTTGYTLSITVGERIELTFDCPESANGLPVTQAYLTVKRFT